jgi:hypothetical protein
VEADVDVWQLATPAHTAMKLDDAQRPAGGVGATPADDPAALREEPGPPAAPMAFTHPGALETAAKLAFVKAKIGLGRIVALCHRSSILYNIR